jgi:enoyl-CoA hydratase
VNEHRTECVPGGVNGSVIGCTFVDGLAEVVISTPPVNALSIADAWALRDLFRMVTESRDVNAVLLSAAGRGFCAGIDYKEVETAQAPESLLGPGRACREALAAITACPLPVVVAVHGFCMGIGAAIAASCDLVVAADDAYFALPEGAWSIAYLSRMVPPMKLRQMALTGGRVDAEEMRQYGSVYRVVARPTLLHEARGAALALCGQSREALIATKSKLSAVERSELDRAFWEEQFHMYGKQSPVGGQS